MNTGFVNNEQLKGKDTVGHIKVSVTLFTDIAGSPDLEKKGRGKYGLQGKDELSFNQVICVLTGAGEEEIREGR